MSYDSPLRGTPAAEDLEVFWDAAGVLFCITNHEQRLLAVNRVWSTILGYETEALLGRVTWDLMHPEDARRLQAEPFSVDDPVGRRLVIDVETRYAHVDGSTRWLRWTGEERDGLWYAVGHDVTSMHVATTALHASQQRTRAVMGALRDGIVTVAPDTRVLEVSPRFTALTGWTARDLIGTRPPYAWWPTEDIPARERDLRNALRGASATWRGDCLRKDGTRFEALVDAVGVPGGRGAGPALVKVVRDLSDPEGPAPPFAG